MLISLPNGDVACGMPVLRCRTCGEDRPTYTVAGVTHCADCLRPIEPLSPVERYLAANVTAAVVEATRTPAPPGVTGLTPHPPSRRETGMTQPYEGTAGWRDLNPGVVIIRDPNHPHVLGEWTVESVTCNGWDVFTHVRCISGAERTFHTFQDTFFATRPAANGDAA